MAAPLSGIGQQQQLPVSQALQPVSNDQSREVRRQESDPQENQVQVREAPAAQSQDTNATSDSSQQNLNDIRFSSASSDSESGDRGTNVDIEV